MSESAPVYRIAVWAPEGELAETAVFSTPLSEEVQTAWRRHFVSKWGNLCPVEFSPERATQEELALMADLERWKQENPG